MASRWPDTTVEERFLAKVNVRGEDECWLWAASTTTNGYGTFSIHRDGRRIGTTAQRAAYMLFVGPIPDGYQIDHLCRVRRCVNPRHLEAVTPSENIQRGRFAQHDGKVCPKGHNLTKPNTLVLASGFKACVTCRRAHKNAWQRAWRAERRAA